MRKLRSQSGTATVEMALILPVLLLILVGSLEFGTLFSTYLRFQNAVREGARVATLGVPEAEITTRIHQFAPGLKPSSLTVSYCQKLGTDPLGGDLVFTDSVYKCDVFYDLSEAPATL